VKYLKQGKFPAIVNLSNQANFCEAKKSILSQFNLIVILGLAHLKKYNDLDNNLVPISIKVTKSGEIELTGLDDSTRENVQIYSDSKISKTQEGTKGD